MGLLLEFRMAHFVNQHKCCDVLLGHTVVLKCLAGARQCILNPTEITAYLTCVCTQVIFRALPGNERPDHLT